MEWQLYNKPSFSSTVKQILFNRGIDVDDIERLISIKIAINIFKVLIE